MQTQQIVLSFDIETDIGSWTSADRGVSAGVPEILRVLENHHVPATFLFTGREARNHPAIAVRVLEDGHEIGCHTLYHETLGVPVYDVPVGSFVLDEEVPRRLELATAAIETVTGLRPVSFRAPRLFGSTAMIVALADLGYTVDSSFPCYYHGRDFRPYHPGTYDWATPGNLPIVELPVFYDAEARGGDAKNRGRDQWPMLRLRGGRWFHNLCRRMFPQAVYREDQAVLCIYLHPWEFIEMPRSITTDESSIRFRTFLHRNTGPFALDALDEFVGLARADGWGFVTMKDFAAKF